MAGPRSTLTLSQLQSQVRSELGMADSTLFTDTDIQRWLNEAQDIIASVCNTWYRTSTTINAVADTKEYELPDVAAGEAVQIQEVRYGASGSRTQLYFLSEAQLRQLDPEYQRAGTGTPQYWYIRGNTVIGLHPTPSANGTDYIEILYAGRPPHASAAGDTFYVPFGTEYALKVYAKMLASEKDITGEGRARAERYERQWHAALAQIKQQVAELSEREIVVVGEEAAYDGPYRDPHLPYYTSIT